MKPLAVIMAGVLCAATGCAYTTSSRHGDLVIENNHELISAVLIDPAHLPEFSLATQGSRTFRIPSGAPSIVFDELVVLEGRDEGIAAPLDFHIEIHLAQGDEHNVVTIDTRSEMHRLDGVRAVLTRLGYRFHFDPVMIPTIEATTVQVRVIRPSANRFAKGYVTGQTMIPMK